MANQNEMVKERADRKIKISSFVPFFGLAIVLVLFASISGGKLFLSDNWPVLLSNIYSIGLGCAGVLFLMATGNMDFSLPGIISASGAIAAIASGGTNAAVVLPVTLGCATGMGFLNGFLFGKLKIPSFITTLGTLFIWSGTSTLVTKGYLSIPLELNEFDNMPLKVGVLIGVFIITYIIFEYTPFGKQCRAIGSSCEAARQSGVNVQRVNILTFTISGLLCGVIAFFLIIRANTAAATTGQGLNFSVLLAMMLGGVSLNGGWIVKFRSVVVGSLLMALVANGLTLTGLNGFDQQWIEAILFIVVVAVSMNRKTGVIVR